MAESLKKKTINGMIWAGCERFGSVFSLFVANLVLARLLSPEDFGIIAMLMVFISISDTIVDAGFGSTLIQKQEIDKKDCSTIFVWNLAFSVFLFLALFFTAPLIASFYSMPEITTVLRIQSIIIPLNGLTFVHVALLHRELKFKALATINLVSILVGSIVGIIFAFMGFGVWSLIIKVLLTGIIKCVWLNLERIWKISLDFDFSRFKSMFGFSGFIFLNRMINTVYHNLLSLIIGKSFSATSLGYYNQARKLEDIPRNALSSIVSSVAFPVFSKISNDLSRLYSTARECMSSLSFISVPITTLMFLIAEPLIIFLFSDKWIQAVSYFRILCFGGLILTPIELNAEIINSKGQSNYTFYIRTFQCISSLIIVILCIPLGISVLLIAYVSGLYLNYIFTCFFSKKCINYGLLSQLQDMLPSIGLSATAGLSTYLLSHLIKIDSNILEIILGTLLYSSLYIILAKMLNVRELSLIYSIIQDWKSRSKS